MEVYKKSPFGPGKNWNLNACIGINGGPYNYADYGRGYFQAGNLIAEHFLVHKGTSVDLPLDMGIYPLLYMYRQGLELLMKDFIYNRKNSPKNKGKHSLLLIWDNSKKEIIKLLNGTPTTNEFEYLNKLEKFITQMNELDPAGETTRFPEDLSGKLFLQNYDVINIEPIYQSAIEILDIFEYFIAIKEECSSF